MMLMVIYNVIYGTDKGITKIIDWFMKSHNVLGQG